MSAQASFTNVSVQKFASEGDAAMFDRNWTEHSPVLLKKLGDLGMLSFSATKVWNQDGDVSFDLELSYKNETDHDIEAIKSSVLIASADGVVAGGSQDDEQDVFIETGGEEEFSIYTSYIAKALLGENLDEINATVDVTFFRSEYQKLGEHEVPETPEAPKVLNNAIDVGDFIKINGMLLYRSKPDEDGDIKLELVMGMRNVSDIHFDKVELKMTLNDRKGAEIDYSTDYGQLPPYSGRVMNPSIWGLSEARLKNCTVNISLDIYQPVAYATSTVTLDKD